MLKLIIYTDGGSRGNPGIGAWSYAIFEKQEDIPSKPIKYLTDIKELTTNNEMELTAVHKALQYIDSVPYIVNELEIRSDSNYVINTLDNWYHNWVLDGSFELRPNHQLIGDIENLMKKLENDKIIIKFTKVKGHSGEPGNEFVDSLLNESMDNWNPKSIEDQLPKLRWMQVDHSKKDFVVTEVPYSDFIDNELSYKTGDVVLVMENRVGMNMIIQAFDPTWFKVNYGIDARDLPKYIIID